MTTNMLKRLTVLALSLLLALACAPSALLQPVVTSSFPTLAASAEPGLPNPLLTPGAIDPRVTQANIYSTICRKGGYTSSVRPPESYTEPLKFRGIELYSYADTRPSHYEEDHLIPLEIGGNPTDSRNLWPEPHSGQWNSYVKDRLENQLHDLVCSGQVPLATAQQAMASNWIAAYQKYMSR